MTNVYSLLECLSNPVGFKGFNIPSDKQNAAVPFQYEGKEYVMRHGSVVISAITSCTNTRDPYLIKQYFIDEIKLQSNFKYAESKEPKFIEC